MFFFACNSLFLLHGVIHCTVWILALIELEASFDQVSNVVNCVMSFYEFVSLDIL